MASSWVERRKTTHGASYRVRYRIGGRESVPRFAGAFRTMREARTRRDWVAGEIAAMRVPDLELIAAEPVVAPLLRDVAKRWQVSRVDASDNTRIQHGTAVGRMLPILGDRPIDTVTVADVAELVAKLSEAGKARETIRKTITALAMVFDFAGIEPNPARNRIHVKLPREDPGEMEPPSPDHVEAIGWQLKPSYLLALLVLDATGCRVGELEQATVGDLDEERGAWLVRAAVSKTRRPRWVDLPADLLEAVLAGLPAREDRQREAPLFGTEAKADPLRTAIARACRDTGTPHFSPHALRHRRISLMHRAGVSWAEIGERVGQRSRVVTADTYTHALIDSREIDRAKLLARVRTRSNGAHPVHTLTG